MPKGHKSKDLMDVVIVGGGPAGCSMAAILGQAGLSVACIDQDDPAKVLTEAFDGRTTAISFGSQRVIEASGAWEKLLPDACPIEDIQIMESGSATLLEFLAKDVDAPAFGWIVENRLLRKNLFEQLAKLKSVQHLAPARVKDYSLQTDCVTVHMADGSSINAKLVIGADGRQSFTRNWMGINTRGWSYKQRAVVCIVHHEHPHDNIAIEDFRGEGPFAVLPMTDEENGQHRSSIVWTEHGPEKDSSLHWSEEAFNAALQERFPDFYGKVSCAGRRFSYPLGLVHAHSYIGERMALVGDAAHGIHPIAGQGLNLGLRDIAALAEILMDAHARGQDAGSDILLRKYQGQRRIDNMAMAAATDTLNKLFSNNITPLRALRRVGLRAVQNIAPARKFFMRQAMGSAGLLPSMIKDKKN
jgi:2-octaprenyl-6-methoxyphenol hydroxylase